MVWQGIQGHDDVVERFRRALAAGRLASTFLFVGPEGIGKRAFALKLAEGLLCERNQDNEIDPCGECPDCIQTKAGVHPDLQLISKPPDKSVLPIELFIGARERRSREGLCHNLSLKPYRGRRKVAIIDDADFLAAEGANCLLKTLEEPPPRSLLILIGTSPEKQLPTILSRCQMIRFQGLPREVIAELALSQGLTDDPAAAQRLARHAEGSLRRAAELAEGALWEFRGQLLAALAQTPMDSVRFSGALAAFVDDAGKEAVRRRARARQVIGFAAELYMQVMRAISGGPLTDDAELGELAQRAAAAWTGEAATAAACAERCLEALEHIDRNANMATLLSCWIDDLEQIAAKGFAPTV